MKLAMAMSLVFLIVRKKVTKQMSLETPVFKRKQYGAKYMPQPRTYEERRALLQESIDGPSWKTMCLIVIPSFLDLFQTGFSFIGLLWIPASVYQLSTGSVVIFSACFVSRCMRRKLYCYQILSILCIMISVTVVSAAGIIGKKNDIGPFDILNVQVMEVVDSEWNQVIGMSFIILAQVIFSAQLVVEERYLTELKVSPLLLIGMEGLWGVILMVPMITLFDYAPRTASPMSQIWHEDFSDTLIKLKNSSTLCCFVLSYMICIGSYSVSSFLKSLNF